MGASTPPSNVPKKFCRKPALMPRRCGEDSALTIARHTGKTGPSAAPMIIRATSSSRKFGARPERNEHAQKMAINASRKGLRTPAESDQRPMRYADNAQVMRSEERRVGKEGRSR